MIFCISGEVPERSNGAVSKTVVVFVATVGSNPTLSAEKKTVDPFLGSVGSPGGTPVGESHPLCLRKKMLSRITDSLIFLKLS